MNEKKIINLVNTGNSFEYKGIDTTFTNKPPVASLPILACETEKRLLASQNCQPVIKAYDRPIIGDNLINELANADVLGLTSWFSNYCSSIELADKVKKINPDLIVVIGGPNATNLGERVLVNRKSIDYVVSGDGEDVLWRIVTQENPATIPNLWFRDNSGSVHFSFKEEIDLNTLATFNFKHLVDINLSEYDCRKEKYLYNPSQLPISLSSIRGCPKAISHGRCGYCSIPGNSLRFMNPDRAWNQVKELHDQYGIESFFESGDDFSCSDFAEQLASSENIVSGIHLRAYSSLWRLTLSKISAFKKIGLSEVFVGLETTDPEVNKWSGHAVSKKMIFRVFSNLFENGINVCMPLLFGLPNESQESLISVENLAYDLVDKFSNIRMVLVSRAVPLIGSDWFLTLMNDSFVCQKYLYGDLRKIDDPEYTLLSELSINRYCSATVDQIEKTIDRIRKNLTGKVEIGCFGAIVSANQRVANLKTVQEPICKTCVI